MGIYDVNGTSLTEDITIKSYYETEMTDTIAKVRAINNEPSLVFPCVTDIHRYSANVTQNFDDMIQNLTYFANMVKCDFLVNAGDTIDGNTTQASSLEQAYTCAKDFLKVGLPIIYSQGNHDNNPYTASGSFSNLDFSIQQVYSGFFANTRKVIYNTAENGTDYYIDYPIGVRVIILNACNVKRAHNYAYGSTTASWLGTALDTDRTVLLIEHLSSIASQVWNNNHGTSADSITSALTTFVNGGKKLVQISGHSHIDVAFVQPWLSVMNVCQKFESVNTSATNYQKITGYVDQMSAPSRTANTYTEDAWTVCVLKPYSYELDCIRFGAGCDRYFHYNPIAPSTLTSRLSDVTWSSSDTAVATVSGGVVTGVANGTCGILAKDSTGNYECWTIQVS